MSFLRRFWTAFAKLWQQEHMPPPEIIGKAGSQYTRPIPIELGFFLHPDGRVYKRDRAGGGDLRVEDAGVKQMVHEEYTQLMRLALKERQWARRLMRRLRAHRGAVATNSPEKR